MSIDTVRSALLAAGAGLLLVGADCEQTGPIAPARDYSFTLHDPGPYQHSYRSQPGETQNWNGRDLAFTEMTAPVAVTGEVLHEDSSPAGGVCVFLDGVGDLGDLSGVADSQGLFTQTILPSTYNLAIAPDCFTGTSPAEYLEDIELAGETSEPWLLPTRSDVIGEVSDTAGNAIVGAIVSVYEAGRPDRPLGLTVATDSSGVFTFQVPPAVRYDILVSSPPDGSVPIAPIRIDNQVLPLLAGLSMKIEYPSLPTAQVIGTLVQLGGVATTGRVRVEGWVPAAAHGPQFSGGTFRAEFETDADGRWERELPRGSYRATAFPRHSNRSFGTVSEDFDVVVGTDLVEVELALPNSSIGRIEVSQSDGNPMVGAKLGIRMSSPPYYSYLETTDEEGAWTGLLIPDIYDVEVIPPEQPETGEQRFARAHGTLDLLSPEPPIVSIQLRRSDLVDGFLYTVGQSGVRGVHVLLADPETGEIWDETVTNDGEFPGFFRATLPR